MSESAIDVELALDLGIGPRLGTNPPSESYIYIYITTCYPIMKPNLKIVKVKNGVILSKITFLSTHNCMHIFNMLVTSVQHFKLVA